MIDDCIYILVGFSGYHESVDVATPPLLLLFFSSLYVPLFSFPFTASKNTRTRTRSEVRREANFSV